MFRQVCTTEEGKEVRRTFVCVNRFPRVSQVLRAVGRFPCSGPVTPFLPMVLRSVCRVLCVARSPVCAVGVAILGGVRAGGLGGP